MSRRDVIVSEAASFDISDLIELILATRGADEAIRVNDQLDEVMTSLETRAHRGRIVPELRARGITIFRELSALPYRVVYRVTETQVSIVEVLDHRRDLDSLLQARVRRIR